MPIDLNAYFARIGYDGPRAPTLEVLHGITAAHTQSIPFENLDVLLGRRIHLDVETVFDKLVQQRRGGYCFEQNGLLLQVLSQLGFAVAPLSARGRWQRTREEPAPRTHVFLRVEIDGESWLTDVGFGSMSQTAAIRLLAEVEQPTPHEARRVVREGSLWFQQARLGSEWHDIFEFTLEEMPAIDRELGNWFTSAHPQSHFRNRLIVARALSGGRRLTLLNSELSLRQADGQAESRTVTSPDELLHVLAEKFDLRFPDGTRFGPPNSVWPS
jgi:N-hydroxyarylamine O-acetyltransferase